MATTPEQQREIEDIAKAVGFAISDWGLVESSLCSLYAAAHRVPRYMLGHKSFYAIMSFQGKVKATDQVFKEAISDAGLLAEWADCRKSLSASNEFRNKLAHGSLQIIYSDPPLYGWFPFWTGMEVSKFEYKDGRLLLRSGEYVEVLRGAEVRAFSVALKAVSKMVGTLYDHVCSHWNNLGLEWNTSRY